MGSRYRTARAAATALLIVAVGGSGTAGLTSALTADPASVALSGTLVATTDGIAAPLAGVELVITEAFEADGGLAAFPVTTAADGTFGADLFAWGSPEDPALVTIAPARAEIDVADASCSRRWAVAFEPGSIALTGAAPDALTVTRTLTLVGEVCGTTGTPPADGPGRGPAPTPPPTNTMEASPPPRAERLGPALLIGFVVGLLAAAAVLRSRPGARRRD